MDATISVFVQLVELEEKRLKGLFPISHFNGKEAWVESGRLNMELRPEYVRLCCLDQRISEQTW